MGLLRCSIRTASILTQGAREAAAARLKAAIVAAFDGAETQTALAKRLGVDQATVQRVWAAERERRVAEDIERRAASAQADADLKRYENRQAAETHNGAGADAQIGPDEQPDDAGHEPVSVAEARQEAAPERVDSTESPAALRWHAVLRAMEAVDALPSSAELFADRFRRFDHVLLPAVGRAHRIINELHGRLFP
jgi:transcriptional regulator with XRE-family HTH domain